MNRHGPRESYCCGGHVATSGERCRPRTQSILHRRLARVGRSDVPSATRGSRREFLNTLTVLVMFEENYMQTSKDVPLLSLVAIVLQSGSFVFA